MAERQPSSSEATGYKGTRPGGRSARVRTAVIGAAAQELAEYGLAEMSLPRIADRAGVALSTIHRRWGSKPTALVSEVLAELTTLAVPDPDHGSLHADLRALAGDIAASLREPTMVQILRTSLALPMEEVAALQERFWTTRIEVAQNIVDRAIARGELPEGSDGWSVVERVNAPIWMRTFVTGLPIDDALLDGIVADTMFLAQQRPRFTRSY